MILDLSGKVKTIEGKDDEKTLGKILAEFIGSETKGNTVKLCHWYGHLLNHDQLELDEPDREELHKLVKVSDRLFVYLKAQLLPALKAKE